MATTRAQKITQQSQANTVYYSDFTVNLDPHPDTGDLFRLTNINAVKRAIANLIKTNFYERPFQPRLGCNILAMLFENITGSALSLASEFVTDCLKKYEPRCNLINLTANAPLDTDTVILNITFSIVNIPQVQTVNVTLTRVR